jgi:hypothetical protein
MRAAVPVGIELIVLANSEKLTFVNIQFKSLSFTQITESTKKVISLYVAAL